ncbi:hypothetical protein CBL_12822 [Carabus blaptoides fortunei]
MYHFKNSDIYIYGPVRTQVQEITNGLKDTFTCAISVDDVQKIIVLEANLEKKFKLKIRKEAKQHCATNKNEQIEDVEARSSIENDNIIFDIVEEMSDATTTPSLESTITLPADTGNTSVSVPQKKRKADTRTDDYLKNATDVLQQIAYQAQDEDDQFGAIVANELRAVK